MSVHGRTWCELEACERGLPLSIECRGMNGRSDTIIMYNSYNRVRPREMTHSSDDARPSFHLQLRLSHGSGLGDRRRRHGHCVLVGFTGCFDCLLAFALVGGGGYCRGRRLSRLGLLLLLQQT